MSYKNLGWSDIMSNQLLKIIMHTVLLHVDSATQVDTLSIGVLLQCILCAARAHVSTLIHYAGVPFNNLLIHLIILMQA